MRSHIVIRPYQAADEAALIELWQEVMWADPIDSLVWRSKYLLDPNFSPGECLMATVGERIVGFVFGISNKSGGTTSGPDGWVIGFGVHPDAQRQGIGRQLFAHLENEWRDAGVTRILIGPYVPTYVSPGVDEGAYPEAIQFLTAIGAEIDSRPLSMKASLTGIRGNMCESSPDTGSPIVIRKLEAEDILPLLVFLDEHFPEWRPEATNVLQDLFGSDPRQVNMLVALEGGEVVGYAQSRNERFGPFGVNGALRGRGIGAKLLVATLFAMRSKGFHCAWFLWTSDRAAKLYREHGFEEVRRFALMSKTIADQGNA
jgi:mycothiol synthase